MASMIPNSDEDDGAPGMSERIRAFDWVTTPLGPMEDWPPSLRFALNLCEHTSYPTAIYWGPDLRLIYNDAWAPIPGKRHPDALGKPGAEVWPDIWDIVGPQFEQVMATGEGFAAYEQLLPMTRNCVEEESYWNYSFTPIFGEDGRPAGILNHGHEITKTVLAERRMSFQVALADRLRNLDHPDEVKAAAAAMLGTHLGAARVGIADVDEALGLVTVVSEWRSDQELVPIAGQTMPLADLPEAAVAHLRSGQVLVLADVDGGTSEGSEADARLRDTLDVRAVVTVALVREGRLRAMLFVHEREPRRWKRSEAAVARDVAERTWAAVERAQIEQSLRDSEDHYRHAVELNPQVSWTALADGQLNRVSRRWHDWTGTPGTGSSWAEGLHPDDRERTFAVWANCVATGEVYDIEHRVQRVDGTYRWARSRAYPRHDDSGHICLWYGTTEDSHERREAEEHQRLLINELNHRVKNTLATVQAIAFQTLKGDIPLAEARARFEARLLALSRAHNLLTDQNWEGASLERVVADAVEHLASDRFEISGAPLWLAPRAALALALAFHELTTNAAKYGALSNDEGRVVIGWSVEGDTLRLGWKEQGGPAVCEPGGRGFGTRLIERGLTADLGGGARLLFEPSGLRCAIEASLSAIQAREEALG